MANPQPDVFVRWSKELWKAIIKARIPGVPRQVFDAIVLLTYGAIPSKKEAQISGKQLMNLTNLNRKTVSKSLQKLLDMKVVTKNGDYRPPSIGINKDYDSWKLSPKKVTSPVIKGLQKPLKKVVTKNGDKLSPKMVIKKNSTFYSKEYKEQSDSLYNFYKTEINPLKKSSARAKENITYYLKKYSYEQLLVAIKNYKKVSKDDEPKYKKDPANFFGKNDRYFIDYLPKNFESPQTQDSYNPVKCQPPMEHVLS